MRIDAHLLQDCLYGVRAVHRHPRVLLLAGMPGRHDACRSSPTPRAAAPRPHAPACRLLSDRGLAMLGGHATLELVSLALVLALVIAINEVPALALVPAPMDRRIDVRVCMERASAREGG